MIARLEVTRGPLTEYPLAEKVCGGWQNGVMFYPDAEVTKVTPLIFRNETPTDDDQDALAQIVCRVPEPSAEEAMSHYTDPADPFWQSHPEPQGEPSNRVIVMCARCGLFPVVGGDEINSDIVVCDRCAFAEGRESAQGEPSDARAKVIDALVMTRLSDFAGTDMGVIEQAADAVLAALRATGVGGVR